MNIPTELAGITPSVLILVQVIKGIGLPKKYLPLLAIVLGIIGAIVLNVGGPIVSDIILGILAGGAAAGLYDAGSSLKSIKKPLDTPTE